MVNPTGANGTDNGVCKAVSWFYDFSNLLQFRQMKSSERSCSISNAGPSLVPCDFAILKRTIKLFRLTTLKTLNRKFKIPSSRKFEAVEEATAAIADIIARDVHQGQGPDTVKRIASLRLNLTIPRFRDFVRATMKGLVGQKPSDMRRPGRGKGCRWVKF
ncbi:hypothetical protein B0H14DRAFT_2580931 [Mycena olivaceomarginata]|nr:hypothetical protein B0H14DRAFT_2580931 [Mycena olivaceomarginata]